MKPLLRLSILFLLHAFCTSSLWAQFQEESYPNITTGGYVKYLSSLFHFNVLGFSDQQTNQLVHQRQNFKADLTSNLSFYAGMRNQLYFGELVKMSPGLAEGLEERQNDLIDLSWNWFSSESAFLNSTFDRLYLEWTSSDWEVSIGRQRINWGMAITWNANDIFNTYSFVDFDYEERPGSDALLIRHYTGATSSIEFAAKLTAKKEDAVFGTMWRFNITPFDFQGLAGYFQENIVVGAGWAGNIGQAGWKGEWSWFTPTNDAQKAAVLFTTGIDYSFPDGTYISGGYLFNQLDLDDYSIAGLFTFDISAKQLYPYKHAFVFANTYVLSPLSSAGITLVYSPVSTHPLFIGPQISYSLASNLDINFIAQIGLDGTDGYGVPFQSYYLRAKWSY